MKINMMKMLLMLFGFFFRIKIFLWLVGICWFVNGVDLNECGYWRRWRLLYLCFICFFFNWLRRDWKLKVWLRWLLWFFKFILLVMRGLFYWWLKLCCFFCEKIVWCLVIFFCGFIFSCFKYLLCVFCGSKEISGVIDVDKMFISNNVCWIFYLFVICLKMIVFKEYVMF